MKKYLLGVFAIALAVGFSAFTKPLSVLTFYYNSSNDVVDPSQSNALVPGEMIDIDNWSDAGNPATLASGPKLGAIQFELDDTPDGAGDGAMTRGEAIVGTKNFYIAQT